MIGIKTLAAAVAVAAVVGLASTATAQTPVPVAPPMSIQTKDSGVLTAATLKTTLLKLGYEPREEKAGDSVIYWITVERAGLKYSVDMNISPNGEKIWAMVPLADIPANAELPAARLLKLLELNQTTVGPSHFVYIPNLRQIYLNRALENREVTSNMVKDLIDRVTGYCETTRDSWDTSKWTEMKTVVAPK